MTSESAILPVVTLRFASCVVPTDALCISVAPTVFAPIAVDSVTFPEPSKETALAVTSPDSAKFLAFAKAVAEDTVPVRLPMNVPATNVSEPTVHLPALSSKIVSCWFGFLSLLLYQRLVMVCLSHLSLG